MIRLFWGDCAPLPDPLCVPQALKGVPLWRREDVLRPQSAKKRKLLLGAGMLFKRGLARCGADAERILKDESGKPRTEGVFFSLSHSGERACLAVFEEEVGCDLERVGKIPPKIFARLPASEREKILSGKTDTARAQAFFLVWTKMESFLKFSGRGIAALFGGADLFKEPPACAVQSFLVGEYALSVCSAREEQVKIEEMSLAF